MEATSKYDVHIHEVPLQPTIVVRCTAKLSELSVIVPRGCGEVWEFVRAAGLPQPGRNMALYQDAADGQLSVEAGAEMSEPFRGSDTVVSSSTPAGLVATTAHIGPYDRLGEAHSAVLAFCAEHGHELAGPRWELYGHWTDNPDELRTDIFYLLKL